MGVGPRSFLFLSTKKESAGIIEGEVCWRNHSCLECVRVTHAHPRVVMSFTKLVYHAPTCTKG